ncbi:hypothetical protein ACJX0J_022825, partial [Zea mays]
YGIVCSSINREKNEKVAIKKMHNVFDNRVDALRTLRELKLLRHLRHENVIALKDIMMPTYKSFKDLHHIIKSRQGLSNDHCQYFLILFQKILHRDLKPGNLLVNANCDLKICDFGLDLVFPSQVCTHMRTLTIPQPSYNDLLTVGINRYSN